MMKKRKIGLVSLPLACLLFATGCDFLSGLGSHEGGAGNAEPDVTIWSAYATEKIMRDKSYDMSGGSDLNYDMAKNEVEGAQFIITPNNDYKVNSFTVEVSDLKSGSNVIKKDAISVYLEKYVRIDKQINNNKAYGIGYMPDPLLPFDIAEEYGENKVEGANQGVYITVQTDKDTPAGLYTGTCTVNIDGKKTYEVAMNVNVWDFAISDEVHTRSLFDIWIANGYMMNYELDASVEMFDKYSAALNEYRLSATSLFIEDSGSLEQTITDFVGKAVEATKNPKVSAFKFPLQYFEGYTEEFTANRTKLFKACAKASTPENCIFDKMVAYFGALIDEPNVDTSRKPLVNPLINSLNESEERAIAELEEEGFFDTLDPEYATYLKEKIRTMPNILTAPYDPDYIDGELTYCPIFEELKTEEARQIHADQREKNGELWWYGCVGPCYPYPTYHLDDHLLGARVLNWMAYDYGIDGNLYWCVNEVDTHKTSIWDVCNYEQMNGDGYLFYPGINYGVDGPIGSMRLQTIRDGNEDYEYLYELGRLAEGLSEYYGEEISASEMLQPIFTNMFTNVKYNTNNANFYSLRKEIAGLMASCSGEEKFVSKGIDYAGDKATVHFNVADGYEVTVNGQTVKGDVCGQGKTYSYTITMDKASNDFAITLTKDDVVKSYTVNAGGKTVVVSAFDKESDVAAVKGNGDNITVEQVSANEWSGNESAAKIEITSTFDPSDPLATLAYRPEFSIKVSDIALDLNNLAAVKVRLYNDTGRQIHVSFLMRTSKGLENELLSTTLETGWNTLVMDGIDKLNWSELLSVSRIIFRFDNTENGDNQVAMPVQKLYLSEIIASYAK